MYENSYKLELCNNGNYNIKMKLKNLLITPALLFSLGCNGIQTSLNLFGGLVLHNTIHESTHYIVADSLGGNIDEISIIPPYYYYDYDDNEDFTNNERTTTAIAGPLASVALSETINYNLRNNNVDREYQSFLATTSLISRLSLLSTAFNNKRFNDFDEISKHSDIPRNNLVGLTLLYTALNYKRIVKEFNVAFRGDYY